MIRSKEAFHSECSQRIFISSSRLIALVINNSFREVDVSKASSVGHTLLQLETPNLRCSNVASWCSSRSQRSTSVGIAIDIGSASTTEIGVARA